jgi:hypothetical protein
VSCPYYQSRLSGLITKSKVEFGLVPAEHWDQPQWINETEASLTRQGLLKDGVSTAVSSRCYYYALCKALHTRSRIVIAQGAFRASFLI